ncbi:LOW QUALITY PROTEIN: acid beta-fructofuranosidase 1, vacuolar-like [Rosa rugosa]|uniref:LOW QUALITY PROTEIN: acid beta-fructofuranosidase 1, vacuolar-like n=1 Tax=Rosa rugosa TaxID=74645 RepID=UPI002B4122FE|nr:LOW QUALITY PROTEIN: acid beta-fructofuranosidase 1, vacuolar-like [Rosa rugosa]
MDTSTSAYAPLPGEDPLFSGHPPASLRRSWKGFAVIFASVLFLLSLVGLIIHQGPQQPPNVMPDKQDEHHHPQSTTPTSETTSSWEPRGKALGVSAKSNPPVSDELSYNWTNAMFSWQRTAFHFQPERNWMNDPNGPLFYKGWYHLFYQYNPDSAIWGNITWGHAVSTDLIHGYTSPSQWSPINGTMRMACGGSATLLPDGQIVMLYTGDTVDAVQVVCLAYPANLSDPLLLDWVKYPGNPVLTPPPGILSTDFRDPTTAWTGPDGKWRITIGSKVNTTGISFVYHTEDFKTYNMSKGVLHAVPGTGMWECIDFYPVAINGSKGVETSVNNPSVKHVLKASLDDTKVDYYALGTYFEENETWVPDNPALDVGIGLRYDYGRYYASKTFYDQNKERRILWGWINETDTESDDLAKGWASVQTIPRSVLFDNKTGTNLIQWPVEEIEELRLNSTDFSDVLVEAGTVVELDIGTATQLDILVEFELEPLESSETVNSSVGCGGGAVDRGTFGPFGILVIADETLTELTPIYFNLANSTEGDVTTYFCADERRSSKAPDVFKQVYGSEVPVLDGEKHFARVLVDHSIVESFAQGGRTVITSRVYPTEAIYGAARLFLFNNATGLNVKATLKIWQLNSAFIHPFPLDQIQ